jgi:hypothetical protein
MTQSSGSPRGSAMVLAASVALLSGVYGPAGAEENHRPNIGIVNTADRQSSPSASAPKANKPRDQRRQSVTTAARRTQAPPAAVVGLAPITTSIRAPSCLPTITTIGSMWSTIGAPITSARRHAGIIGFRLGLTMCWLPSSAVRSSKSW